MSAGLDAILAHKRDELAALRRAGRAALEDRAARQDPPRGFAEALRRRVAAGSAAVIAEVKKASPSAGVIRADFDPAAHARDYARGGAACLSVLTDARFFQGAGADLEAARAACDLPALRKDFTLDPLHVLEARALGADAVLLIAAALADAQMTELAAAAAALRLDVLVEVHDRAELARVLGLSWPQPVLLGINNRDLRTFVTRVETTLELLPEIPEGWEIVTESGLKGAADLRRLRAAGVQRFLVGESLMREPDPGEALRRWLA